jgi:tape measure domain-containing protein
MADIKIDIIARDKSQKALNNLNKNLNKSKVSVFNLKNALIAIGSSVIIKQFFTLSNTVQQLENRLKLVTTSTEQLNKVYDELFQISRRTRGGLAETVELYQKLALQSQSLGLASEDLLQITENVNKVIGIAGVGSIQASSGILQLSQAFASGRLQGDEFRSISENIPPLLDIFAKQLGVTRGELKKLGSEGKITSEVIAKALLVETENINEAYSKLAPTLGQATTRIVNSFTNLTKKFNETTGFANKTANVIVKISDAIDNLSFSIESLDPRVFQAMALILGRTYISVDEIQKAIYRMSITNPYDGAIHAGMKLHEIQESILVPIHAFEHELSVEIPSATDKAIAKFRELNEGELNKLNSKLNNVEMTIAEGINSGITQMSQGLARSIVFGESLQDVLANLARNILVNILSTLIEQIVREKILVSLNNYKLTQLSGQLAIEQLITEEKRKQAAYSSGGSSSMGSSLVSTALSFFDGFANGGAVSKGKPIVVGERGAELFIPNQSGQITQSARGTGGGQTTVNFNINTLDASGFEDLLVRSRGTITQLINNAVNERGRESLI